MNNINNGMTALCKMVAFLVFMGLMGVLFVVFVWIPLFFFKNKETANKRFKSAMKFAASCGIL